MATFPEPVILFDRAFTPFAVLELHIVFQYSEKYQFAVLLFPEVFL